MVRGRELTIEEELANEKQYFDFLKNNPEILEEEKVRQEIREEAEKLKQKKSVAPEGFSNKGLKLDNYMDNVETFYKRQPFFFDKNQIFWMWNKEKNKYERVDETDIMNLIDEELGFGGQTINSRIKNNYLEAFKRTGRKHTPKNPDKKWVQFKNKIINIITEEEINATPEYFICNPIPWNANPKAEMPTIKKLFQDWMQDNEQNLFEIIAYCCLADYPIHTIIALIGAGRNGKSSYIQIVEKFLGQENITSTELDTLLDNRFESAKLYKKLACTMGETNFGMMNKTSLLKKLCGGDLIGFEFKNKNPFDEHNYAKIIISSNSLPTSADTTDGFYRRWLILHFDNVFPEGKDITNNIPDSEFEALAFKSKIVLKQLLERGDFTNRGSIDERRNKYILASNPLSLFIKDCCEINDSFYVKAKDLYHTYLTYLQLKKRRKINRKEFNQLLAEEGYQPEHTKRKIEKDGVVDFENSHWVDGLRLKKDISPFSPFSPVIHLYSPIGGSVYTHRGKEGNQGKNDDIFDTNDTLYTHLVSLIIDKVPQEAEVSYLISYGISDEMLEKWKAEGKIYEPRSGVIKLL